MKQVRGQILEHVDNQVRDKLYKRASVHIYNNIRYDIVTRMSSQVWSQVCGKMCTPVVIQVELQRKKKTPIWDLIDRFLNYIFN
jgi:hypothetical protein